MQLSAPTTSSDNDAVQEVDIVFPSQHLQVAVKNALAGLLSTRKSRPPSAMSIDSIGIAVDSDRNILDNQPGAPPIEEDVGSAMAVDNEDIGARLAVLKEDATVRKLHKDLVQTSRTMTEEEFWETRQHLLRAKRRPSQIKGIPNHLLSFCKPRQLANGTVGYQVPDELKQLLLSRKKKLEALYQQQVPAHMTEEHFWNKYMASAQNHYNKSGTSQKAKALKKDKMAAAQGGGTSFKTHAMETGGPVDVFDALEDVEGRISATDAAGKVARDIDLSAAASDHYYAYGNLPDKMMISGSTDESQRAVHFLSHLNRDNAYFVKGSNNASTPHHVHVLSNSLFKVEISYAH